LTNTLLGGRNRQALQKDMRPATAAEVAAINRILDQQKSQG
jgi:hypothetical protein